MSLQGTIPTFMNLWLSPGPEPVAYQFGYSTDLHWKDNFDSTLYFGLGTKRCRYFQFGTGAHLFRPDQSHKQDYTYEIEVDHEDNCGITNVGQGPISGKTSHKNLAINVPNQKWGGRASLSSGSGEVKTFKSRWCTFFFDEFLIEHEEKPNGNQVYYDSWCFEGGNIPYNQKIRSLNSDGSQTFGSIEFKKCTEKYPSVIETSDGRKMGIAWSKIKNTYLPVGIGHPHHPYYNFEYLTHFQKPVLLKIFNGKGRKTELAYWGQGLEADWRKKNLKRGRVQSISKLLGGGRGNCNLYQFDYTINEDKNRITGGKTSVKDALGYNRYFSYNNDFKITSILHTSHKAKLKTEYFEWCQEKIVSKTIKDNKERPVFERHYRYDNQGNLTYEYIKGIYTGRSDSLEEIMKASTHSDDGFNNLVSCHDGDTLTQYKYKENTDLCTHEYTTCEGRILVRKFREYDNNATLIREIVDDGNAEGETELSGVTQRLIRTYTPKKEAPCIGLPIEIRESYLDLDSKEEKLLKRYVNEYTREGWLTRQDVYDANDNYCYTLEWEYNRFGKPIREVDALGHIITKDYDIYGNMISEEGPKPKQMTLYDYNYSDQPIRKEVCDGSGLSLVETYKYNKMGHMTHSQDIFGCETVFTYDSFGRSIEKILPGLPAEGSVEPVSIKQEFDCFNNPVQTTDPSGRITKTSYNIYGKPIQISYPDGSNERNYYNLNGTLNTHISKNGTETHYDYDCLKRMISKTIISSTGEVLSAESNTYQGLSLISHTDPSGVVTSYTYDGAGRKTSMTAGNKRTTYEYDSLGRLNLVKKWSKESQFTAAVKEFDFLDRVIEERVEDETGKVFSKKQYDYDEMGNQTKVIEFIEDKPSITETQYNCLGAPTKIIDPEGNITTIQYRYDHVNEYGQTVLQTLTTDPKGISTIETFNTHQKPATIEKRNPLGEVIQRLDNHYDLCGNCIETVYTIITPERKDRTVVNQWDYDCMNRPIRLTEAKGSEDERTTLTTYNTLGTIETVTKPNGVVIHHEYNDLGLLSRQYSEGTTPDQAIDDRYTYDLHNNITCIEDKIHKLKTLREYNDHSELVYEKLANGHTGTYEYDPLSRCIKTTIDDKQISYSYTAAKLRDIRYRGYTHTSMNMIYPAD